MISSDWAVGSMVVGDQGALVGRADLPVPPDPGGQRQQSLSDPDPDSGQGAAAVLFQPELAFEGLEGALDPLPEAAQRSQPTRLIRAVGAQQHRAIAGDQLLELLPSEALVAQDDQSPAQPGALMVQQGRDDLTLTQFGAGQAPGDREPVGGGQDIEPGAPEVGGVALAVAVAGMAGQLRPVDRLAAGRARHRGGVDQAELVTPAGGVGGDVLDRQGDQRRGPTPP